MNTTENNKLIAEFMGLTLSDGDWIGKDFIGHEPTGSMLTRNIRFHSSWDWLMPVVAKCLLYQKERHEIDMEIRFGYDNGKCILRAKNLSHDNYKAMYDTGYDILVCEDNMGIKTVYKTVVEFIKWYNKNK